MQFSTLTLFTVIAAATSARPCAIGSLIAGDGSIFSTESCTPGTGTAIEFSAPFQVGCDASCHNLPADTVSISVKDILPGCTGNYCSSLLTKKKCHWWDGMIQWPSSKPQTAPTSVQLFSWLVKVYLRALSLTRISWVTSLFVECCGYDGRCRVEFLSKRLTSTGIFVK